MKRIFIKTLIASVALAAAGVAMAQDKTIKFATQNPKGHPIVLGMEKFKEVVESKSGGKIKVNLFPGGTLGSDQANVSAMQGGTLEMVSMNSGILASQVKEFAIFDFPFMFPNEAVADAVVDGPFGQKMHAKLQDKGLVGLGYYELGFRQITNSKRPITKVEDVKGLKLRVPPDATLVDIVQALGADAQQIKFSELYVALQQGVVDGQENPLANIHASKLYEVQKHLALTNHQFQMTPFLMSKRSWDRLSDADKKAVQEAAAEATALQRKMSAEADEKLLADLKSRGVQVTTVDKNAFAKATEKVDDKWLATPIGAYLKKVIAAAR